MRLVIVSNRLPFTVSFEEGKPRFTLSTGGLTSGLWRYLERLRAEGAKDTEFLWVGWPAISVAPEQQTAVREFGESNFKTGPIFLPEESMDRFYLSFCNSTLWHLFPCCTTLERFEAY